MDGQTGSALTEVSLSWETKVNKGRFIAYDYRHCQPKYVYHYCSLPPLISLTDARKTRKAFGIFILYLLICRAYLFPVIHTINPVTCFLEAFFTLLTFPSAS